MKIRLHHLLEYYKMKKKWPRTKLRADIWLRGDYAASQGRRSYISITFSWIGGISNAACIVGNIIDRILRFLSSGRTNITRDTSNNGERTLKCS
mmetsp:Transcript_26464/g.64482  ORF Transcript_26464/g.64482 Transcript_26464/m.64482 type:complete len:94 (-) Transcript_26464:977-1258(-)